MRIRNDRLTSVLGASLFRGTFSKLAIAALITLPIQAHASVTLVSPAVNANVTSSTPEFVWQDQANATHFQVQVRDVTNNNTKAKWWKRADVCDGSTCRSTIPGVDLEFSKNHWWRARVRTSSGWQAWTTPVSRFHYPDSPPGNIQVNGPIGTTTDTTPTYSWNHIDGVTIYRLWAKDFVQNKSALFANYKATDVCSNGVCTVDSAFEFATHNTIEHQWMIRGVNSGGWNAWSSRYKFKVQTQDNTAPIVSINADPGGLKPGSFTISGTATDETGGSGVERVLLRIVRDDGYFYTNQGWQETSTWPWVYTSGLTDWSYSLDLDVGSYSVIALARDESGNQIWGNISRATFTVEEEPLYKDASYPWIAPITTSGNQVLFGGVAKGYAGNSLFWTSYGVASPHDSVNGNPKSFYDERTVIELKENWSSKIIRAAMGTDPRHLVDQYNNTYLLDGDPRDTFPIVEDENETLVHKVADAAHKQEMYVIIDWHSHAAHLETDAAVRFFQAMATTYGSYNNVIYEIYNEPKVDAKNKETNCNVPGEYTWSDIKPYAERVIDAIREIDEDNLIVVGTPCYSQGVDDASKDPLDTDIYSNIAYGLHFYADSHDGSFMDKARVALGIDSEGNKLINNGVEAVGIPLFVTEWGTTHANGGTIGGVNEEMSNLWLNFLQTNNISHINWAINNKPELSSALKNTTSKVSGWDYSSNGDLTQSGRFVRAEMERYNECLDLADGNTGADCVVDVSNIVRECVETDTDNYDGYGWDGLGSCTYTIDGNTTNGGTTNGGTTNSGGNLPVCVSANSDPDGDGYGWENNKSCTVSNITPTDPVVQNPETPVCQHANSDPDGDGWGWENNKSCTMPIENTDVLHSSGHPYCQSTASDPDGDGWGWENNKTCVVR